MLNVSATTPKLRTIATVASGNTYMSRGKILYVYEVYFRTQNCKYPYEMRSYFFTSAFTENRNYKLR